MSAEVDKYDEDAHVAEVVASAGSAVDIMSGDKVVTSLPTDDFEQQLVVFEALSDPTAIKELKEGTKINLTHFVAMNTTFRSADNPDEMQDGIAVYLLDDEGKSYITLSSGIRQRLQQLIGLAGHPLTWERPIPIAFAMKDIGNGRRVRTFTVGK